ncbi:Protein disulfide isomerase-like 1-3 [Orobanche minor]
MKSLITPWIFLCLICSNISICSSKSDEDDDLSFLEQQEQNDAVSMDDAHQYGHPRDYENYDDLDDDELSVYAEDGGGYAAPEVDESYVVVLKESNFSEFIEKNRFVMVEFYAPWCGHCQALAPEYAAAAEEMKDESVVLAKVDASEETELSQKFDVQGFPTVYFFVDGVHKPYPGHRTKDAIVTWLKKKIGPCLHNITTIEEAERILANEDKIVLGFLESLVGSDSDELAAASKLEDDVTFYQTTSRDVAKLFQTDPHVKRPSLIILKKEAEELTQFSGQFTKSAIVEFVYENKLPLVTNFTRESATLVFESPIKKQLILFATSSDSKKFYPVFLKAAKAFKGKLLCIYVELDNEDVGKEVSEHFGVSEEVPNVLAYTGNDDARKFLLDGELTINNIKSFGEKFLSDNLKPFDKSDPIPENNDGDVKIVVGNNFDEIVLDESKDVLLEIYAPGCGHCQALEPIYNKLGKHLRGINSLVIAKMDGTTNEHPRAKPDGFPTLLFFPAGNKSFDPITFDTDRTVVAFYKFLKKHASIPFKLQKPEKHTASQEGNNSYNVKDEL